MSRYYSVPRNKYVFDPEKNGPDGSSFRLSRSKIDLFLECPACFYTDIRLGVKRPPGYPFNLNSAVDHLLKQEFDRHRAEGSAHPLMEEYGIEAVPFSHDDLDDWRHNFTGVQYVHEGTNLHIYGAVDDVWKNPEGELIVVDYKATSKDGEVSLDADWQITYKRQVEVYQWLLRQNGFDVSDTTYFVYANGDRDKKAFDKKLEFDVKVIPYVGDAGWVEDTVEKAHTCLMANEIPEADDECDYCLFRATVTDVHKKHRNEQDAGGQETLF